MSNHVFLQPQEVESLYIIPALRKHFAVEMKKNGLKQKQIASLLCIEDAAVSQYLNDKRGNKIKLSKDTLNEVSKSTIGIRDKASFLRETQRILRFIGDTGEICKIHKQVSDVPEDCTPVLAQCFK
ncbi:hypothetical protein HY500_02280 [Candidatus Woesearchaeota archaeon]|nr:hypothetical protein [Candidatus Woesearchaeota archaeon]